MLVELLLIKTSVDQIIIISNLRGSIIISNLYYYYYKSGLVKLSLVACVCQTDLLNIIVHF